MTDNNNELVQEWYKFSMRDFDSAKYLCNMHPKPLEIICYLSQQSAEKMLKGFLISNDIEAPKIHDLQQLRIMCLDINKNFEELKGICAFLNRFGTQPRYPNEIEVLEIDVERALQGVQKMIEFFTEKGILKNPDDK